jgi:uncharacterized protein YcnI
MVMLAAAGVTAAMLLPAGAAAHAYVSTTEVNAGWKQDIEIRIPHGCKGSPTTEVRVRIPDGMVAVMPEHNRNWKISTKMRKLPEPVRGEGGVMITETVDEITWTGNTLPDHMFERFVFRATIPNEPGRMLWFKTIQKCQVGEHRWVEVPTDMKKIGEFFKSTPEPAAFTMIVKPSRSQYPF